MKWISVKDQKPMAGERYIICISAPEIGENISFVECAYFCCRSGWDLRRIQEQNITKLVVTHWMNLPEKPT